ncbi:MAG: class I SAM-dependent methyltransferase, partial [Candidatus Methanomethyliaceae archaeon]
MRESGPITPGLLQKCVIGGGSQKIWPAGCPIFRKYDGKFVLDIGAGECLMTFVIAEMGHPNMVVALELILHRMLAASKVKMSGLVLVCGDCLNLPFSDCSFDIVVGNGILHHLPIDDATAEIARVLKPGGLFLGREPNFLNPFVRRIVLGRHRSPNERALMPSEIKAAFARRGLAIRLG